MNCVRMVNYYTKWINYYGFFKYKKNIYPTIKNKEKTLNDILILSPRCDIGGCKRPRPNTIARAGPRFQLLGTTSVISAIRVLASTPLDAWQPEYSIRVAI